MKLTKKLEQEILKAYNAYWDAYLHGDMKTFASMMDENIQLIGSSKNEVFTNRKSAVRFYTATASQLTGKAEMRNRKISLRLVDNNILVNEQMDFYFLSDKKWAFYSHGRLSTLFHKTGNNWKIIHQHGSLPDARAEEGEQLGAEKIKKENQQLREAVKRRTIELEQKNRELEIETALEKVRTIAMGMKEPADMLDVCKTISLQLQSLSVKDIRNVQTAIFYVNKGTYMNYQYYARHHKTFITETIYTDHKIAKAFAAKMLTGKGEFYITHIKGQKVKDWLVYQKTTNVFIDRFLEKARSLNYYWHSLGPVALGISTYSPLNKDELSLFNRFLNVFELAYTRYLDIEQALVQAKEARIELALERVRARAMAMQNSDELAELVTVVFKELTQLDFIITSCIIWINKPELSTNELWVTSAEMNKPARPIFFSPFQHSFFKSIIHAWKEKDPKWIYVLSGREKNSFEKWFFNVAPGLPGTLRSALTIPQKVVFSASFNNFGALEVLGTEPLSDEKFNILHRFGKVFDSSYTRFNDLQKAEEQAREAQIQLALERVRARTMAMQKSEELQDATLVLFQQFKQLRETTNQVSICIFDEEVKMGEMFVTLKGEKIDRSFPMELDKEVFVMKKAKKAFLDKQKQFSITITGKELQNYNHWRNILIGRKGYDESNVVRKQSWHVNAVFFSAGMMGISSETPASGEAIKLLDRFANVFDVTYTRFNDLKKAEAQAREAQIELGLERVRARAMAMQKSDELSELVDTVFKELTKLDFALTWCIINIIDEPSMSNMVWAASPDIDKAPDSYHMKFEDYPFHHAMMKGWKERKTKYVYVLEGLEKKVYDEYLFNETEFRKVPEAAQAASRAMEKYVVSFSFSNFGGLQTVGDVPLSDANLDILSRFGKVFDLTYTRFNDLKQAEAQARESQIQLALERVRARTMAMQRSDELTDAASLLFKQLEDLGIKSWSSGFNIWQTDGRSATINMCNPDGSIATPYHLPHTEDIFFIRISEARQRGDDLLVMETGGKELEETYNYMFSLPEVKKVLGGMEDTGFQIPKFQVNHCAFFSQGYLMFITYEPVPEMWDMFKRFAKVFEQTYTRFLDLQKAEAQAREAQIEAALERVRSRTMGMQKSEELKEVIQVVYDQFVHLNIKIEHTGFVMDYKARDDYDIWIADPLGVPSQVTIPYFDSVYYNRFNEAKEKGEDFFATNLSFEEKNRFYQKLFEYVPGLPEQAKEFYFSCPGLAASTVLLDNVCLYIENFSGTPYTYEDNNTLMRFGKVFQQTYTRFLDLQKAEAQAREAKIEAALERTRTQSMIMQHSNELDDSLRVFHQQVLLLGIDSAFSFLWLPDEDKDRHIFWAAWAENIPAIFRSKAVNYPLDRNEPATAQCLIDWKSNEPVYSYHVPPAAVENYFAVWSELIDGVEQLKPEYFKGGLYYIEAFMKYGCFGVMVKNELKEDEKKILARFAIEFERTYTRFLDLQKAEAQAREAQIEAALERVRSRAMAMHKTDELLDAAELVAKELSALGISSMNVSYAFVDEEEKYASFYSLNPVDGKLMPFPFIFPHTETEEMRSILSSWKKQEPFHVLELDEEGTLKHQTWVAEHIQQLITKNNTDITFSVDAFLAVSPKKAVLYTFNFTNGYLFNIGGMRLTQMQEEMLLRFTKVFEMTYRRFLDLKQAEAQAREAQIETSLERVRSKTMAMHNSQDVADTVSAMFDELLRLGIKTYRCGIGIMHDTKPMELWTAKPDVQGKADLVIGRLDMSIHPLFRGALNGWKNKKDSFSYDLKGDDLINYYRILNSQPDYPVKYDLSSLPPQLFHNGYYFQEGTLFVFSLERLSAETSQILKRFAGVFGQTYRRYLDLQKAEAQARESQIQLALERVRARTMAMQRSDELSETAAVLFEQLNHLGESPERTFIGVVNEEEHVIEIWATQHGGIQMNMTVKATIDEPTVMNKMYTAWKVQKKSIVIDLQGEELESYYQFLKGMGAPVSREIFGERRLENIAFFSKGMLGIITPDPRTPEAIQLYERFAGVFDLTYTRFLDLKKAEANAREARIEAAMEKVRARALAMQKPHELTEVAEVLRKEMGLLGVEELETSSIYIHNEASGKTECWFAMKDTRQEKKLVADHMTIDLNETGVGRQMFEFYRSGKKQISILMQGASRKEWINYCAGHSKVFGASGFYGDNIPDRTYHLYKFSNGYMGAASPGDISAESWDLLQRATSVFSLAYTRFSDLQQAEASTREAIKQAALDRIRAEIASMRTVADLDKITPLIWNELTILGIPFIRCGVFIMDESQKLIHTFLSTPDGKAIAAFHLPYDTPGNIAQILAHWQEKKNYIDHWDEAAFTEFAHTLVKQGALASPEQYLATLPRGGFYLHFLPFLQGMLYVGNTTQLGEDEINLLQSVADAFATAYARYEDFNKLEAAKQQVDKTLVDLKQTQQQLVQSEKMASLGELTAGIAHEIQNPLNFVNNFSEVSNELIDEMIEEVAKGNYDEVKAIADDVKQNLEKINHHGKRADGIVKGMLQHSRSSSGVKEPTNINALADEYLRLAYHGLRAKDKSFNATMKTDYDESIGNINIIPQDIGRVILNLITNAFYVVTEKKKSGAEKYEPTVSVSTKKVNGKVEIKVADNGNGIPQKVLDKIFQPFFTTKPTGQGTGLGLSLSYDIIKAHGGELKVETKEGEGTIFSFQLNL